MSEHGNNAAMREALERLRDWALMDINENAVQPEEVNYRKLVDGIVEITNAALSAPPRNCDKHANVKDAKTAWFNYKMSCPTPPGGWGDVDLFDWFLSPAEGEKKENSHDNA